MKFWFSGKFSTLVYAFTLLCVLQALGQEQFEGIICYTISNSGENGTNLPHKSEFYLKGQNMMIRVYTESGDVMTRILLNGGNNTLFMIDDSQKTALKIHFTDNSGKSPGSIPDQYKNAYEQAIREQENKSRQSRPELVPAGVTEKIAGYKCMKYRIENNIKQDKAVSFIWLTEDILFSLPDRMITDKNPLFQFIGESGFPLKLSVSSSEESMEMIATRIDERKLKDDLFVVPVEYSLSDISSLMMNR